MLDKLYKKLYLIFICGIMCIISVIICVVLRNQIRTDESNSYSLTQRMTTLIIFQFENNKEHFEENIKAYEKQYDLYCNVRDILGKTVYESNTEFPTDSQYLLSELGNRSLQVTNENITNDNVVTEPGGIFKIHGENGDVYLGIPSKVVSEDRNIYYLTVLYRTNSLSDLLREHIWLYILIWGLSLICVIMLSRLVLKRAFEPTERILKSQKEFIASASHELKSPLAVILANVEKLNNNRNADDQQKSVEVMGSECMRMSKLINDMLTLASSDAKAWSLNKKNIDVDTLLISLYEAYEPICIKEKISLKLNLDNVHFPPLFSDPERITQVLSAFLDNAIRHSGGSNAIEIQAAVTSKAITLLIVDHGCGVAEKDKSRIFDRFYCGDKAHTDKSNFGLGLSIANELTQMLGGKIGCKDTTGGGATFYITIPRVQPIRLQ